MPHSYTTPPIRNRGRGLGTALVLGFLAVLTLFTLLGTEPANAASGKRVVLGRENLRKFDPNCGKNFVRECIIDGKITGFQSLSKVSPGRNFVVPFKGKIVSWSIELARPTTREITEDGQAHAAQKDFFDLHFGSPAQARISVLKRVQKKKKGGPRYEMVRQSPVEVLNPYFGSTVQFALSEPLNVIRNQIVALTIPTWAPAFWRPAICNPAAEKPAGCVQAESDYTWRASRAPDKCGIGLDSDGEANEALAKSRPQQKVGSVKRYGCYYGSNVLLYSATIVGPAGE